MTIICGSEALGLRWIRKQFEKLFKDLGSVGSTRTGQYKAWKELKLGASTLLQSEDSFISHLKQILRRRKRGHRYAVIRLDELSYEGAISHRRGSPP